MTNNNDKKHENPAPWITPILERVHGADLRSREVDRKLELHVALSDANQKAIMDELTTIRSDIRKAVVGVIVSLIAVVAWLLRNTIAIGN